MKSCYKCGDRKLGCHSMCEKYKEELAEYKAIKEIRDKDNRSHFPTQHYAKDYRYNSIKKLRGAW